MLLGWRNLLRTATLTASAQATGLGPNKLKSDQGGAWDAWQTPAGTTTATLQGTLAAPDAVRAMSLHRTNLTGQAQLRWRLYLLTSQTGDYDLVDDNGQLIVDDYGNAITYHTQAGVDLLVHDSGLVSTGVVTGLAQAVLALPSYLVATRFVLDIQDPGNPDGFLNIPLAFMGPAWDPLGGLSYGTSLGYSGAAREVVTRGGQVWSDPAPIQRQWNLQTESIRKEEVWPQVMEMDRYARSSGNVLFVPQLNDLAGAGREAVYGILKPSAPIGYRSWSRHSWAGTITERF
jgi:hypothetical protein